jgi:mRNA interferase RelE/StbE
MPYQVILSNAANKQLRKLPIQIALRIQAQLLELENDPRPLGCKKLINTEAWRIRIGDYRVIYEIKDTILMVSVIEIGHRKEIYKK